MGRETNGRISLNSGDLERSDQSYLLEKQASCAR